MSVVKVAQDFQGSSVQNGGAVTSQSEFYFEMPETKMLPSLFNRAETEDGFQSLPPSIRIVEASSKKRRAAGQSTTLGICDITYYIEARLFLKGRMTCDASREIIVMPVTETPPPIEPEDLRNEYRLFASSPMGISWRRRHDMTISISSLEPRPLIFEASKQTDVVPSTHLLLRFSTQQILTGDASEELTKPEIANCDLTITLEATTYFLQYEEHSVLSFAEAQNTPFSVVKTARFKTQRQNFRLLDWKRSSDVNCKFQTKVPSAMETYP
jgi:hypothetical protein